MRHLSNAGGVFFPVLLTTQLRQDKYQRLVLKASTMKIKILLISAASLFLLSSTASAREDISLCKSGWAETQSGNHDKAINLFTQCIEKGDLSPQSLSRTYRNMGIAHRRNNQANLALAYYDKSRALNPSDPWNDYINKGNAYSEMKMYEEALKEYASAEKENPKYGEVQYNRGIVYERQGQPELAAAEFRKAYELGLRTQLLRERMVAYKLIEPTK